MKPHFLKPLLASGTRHLVLRNSRNGHILAARAEGAFASAERRKGLLGRTELEEGAALIIAPCSAIHTFFMKFAIDVAFVDRRGVVVKTHSTVAPWRIAVGLRGFAAVELPAGTLDRTQTMRGDHLVVESTTPRNS